MRDRRRDLCPRCGHRMTELAESLRSVRGGMWVEVYCPNCLHRADRFIRINEVHKRHA